MTHHPLQSSIWLTPILQPWPVYGCWQWACNSYRLGQDFHFLRLDLGALAKPVSVAFYGRAWPLDHGLGATEQPAKGPHNTPGAWNLRMKLHLAVFNWKQKAYSPVSPLGCPWGAHYLRTISVSPCRLNLNRTCRLKIVSFLSVSVK